MYIGALAKRKTCITYTLSNDRDRLCTRHAQRHHYFPHTHTHTLSYCHLFIHHLLLYLNKGQDI